MKVFAPLLALSVVFFSCGGGTSLSVKPAVLDMPITSYDDLKAYADSLNVYREFLIKEAQEAEPDKDRIYMVGADAAAALTCDCLKQFDTSPLDRESHIDRSIGAYINYDYAVDTQKDRDVLLYNMLAELYIEMAKDGGLHGTYPRGLMVVRFYGNALDRACPDLRKKILAYNSLNTFMAPDRKGFFDGTDRR